MKFFSFLVTFFMSFSLIAADGVGKGFVQIVDEFQYSLSVEWDQKDKVHFDKITKKFRTDLLKVISDEGTSREEIIKFFEKRITDKRILNDLILRTKLSPQSMTSSDLLSLIEEFQSSQYRRGASWNGDFLGEALPTATLVGAFVFALYLALRPLPVCKGETVITETNCGIRSVCVKSGDGYCSEYAEQYKCDKSEDCVL